MGFQQADLSNVATGGRVLRSNIDSARSNYDKGYPSFLAFVPLWRVKDHS